VTDERLRQLRQLHRRDRAIPPDLYDLLRDVAGKFVGLRLLPPPYAPYGRWDAEAVDEILQAWLTDRLLGRGHLQRMLDQAASAPALKAMLERSLRQHLIAQKSRSQLGNTYRRALKILESDSDFAIYSDSAQRHQVYWGLATWSAPPLYAGDEPMLLAHAWSLGEFKTVRYRNDAKKLPPVLPGEELKRFITGLLVAVAECLTLSQVMRVMERRFDLGEIAIEELSGDEGATIAKDAADELALEEVAIYLLAELTPRQADVISGRGTEMSLEELAETLKCSPATIFNEEKRINALISREADNPEEARELLKMIADLLYMRSGDG
jgi:hypothetical protein